MQQYNSTLNTNSNKQPFMSSSTEGKVADEVAGIKIRSQDTLDKYANTMCAAIANGKHALELSKELWHGGEQNEKYLLTVLLESVEEQTNYMIELQKLESKQNVHMNKEGFEEGIEHYFDRVKN